METQELGLSQRKSRGCIPRVKTLSPSSQVCQAQPHSLLNSGSASLTIGVCQVFQAGGCPATEPTKWREETWAMFVPPLLPHASATWPPPKELRGPHSLPGRLIVFSVCLTSWVGCLANPRDPHATASPALGLQLHITMPGFCFLTWVLGGQMQVSMLTRQAPYPPSHLPSTRHDFFSP